MNNWIFIISIISIIISLISGILSFLALAYIIGLKNSTHTVERIPAFEENPELDKLMKEDIFKDMV